MANEETNRRVATLSDLVKLGYPEEWLRSIVKHPRQNFAYRQDPANPKSRWIFLLDRFWAFEEKQIQLSR